LHCHISVYAILMAGPPYFKDFAAAGVHPGTISRAVNRAEGGV
jgi:hypothetical protein